MKRIFLAFVVLGAVVFSLAACGGSGATSASSSTKAAYTGFGYEDTGAGTMTLVTAGGSSKDGNIPQVASTKTMSAMQITLEYEGGDGTLCTLYIDGNENEKINAAARMQRTVNLQGDALGQGVHTVEMLAKDGDTVKLYKKAQYEIVW